LNGVALGIELQFARYHGQKHKPTNLTARSKNASRQGLATINKKKKNIYIYIHTRSISALVKRSSRRTRGLLFMHDHVRMLFLRDIYTYIQVC